MLVACRLAGLSGLEAHYAGLVALTQSPPLDQPHRLDRGGGVQPMIVPLDPAAIGLRVAEPPAVGRDPMAAAARLDGDDQGAVGQKRKHHHKGGSAP